MNVQHIRYAGEAGKLNFMMRKYMVQSKDD